MGTGWERAKNSLKLCCERAITDILSDILLYQIICISECTALPETWTNMNTDTVFPVNYGDVATVTCSTGSVLSGDNVITCQEGTEFIYTDVPTCSVLGKPSNEIKY